MRKLLTLILPVFFCLATVAQTSMFDSLDLILPELPDGRKYQVFQRLHQRLERFEDWEKRTVAAHQFRNYAQDQEDSIMLRYALEVLRDLYAEQGDIDKAADFSRQLKALAGAFGYRVSEGFRDRHPVYGYRYTRLYHSLQILEDPDGQLDFETVLDPKADSAFQANYSRERGWHPEKVHWVKMHLSGHPYREGEYLFVPECGTGPFGQLLSWDTVDVFIRYEDGGLEEQQTGTALHPIDKEFRDGFNFFEVSLETRERATLFLRLKGGVITPGSEGIALRMIEKESLLEFEGVRPLEIFQIDQKGAGYAYTPLTHSLELMADTTGRLGLSEVIQQWDDRSFFNETRPMRWDQVHWLRLRLLGDGEKVHRLLLTFPVSQSFRNINIFLPTDRPGVYVHRTIGIGTAPRNRLLRNWASLLPYELAQEDEVDIYFRLAGYMGDRNLPGLRIRYIDENSFWPDLPYRMLLHGLILGAVSIFLLYFLLKFYFLHDRLYLYLSLFLLGSGLFYIFSGVNRELAFMIYPASFRSANIAFIAGRTFLVLGFIQFGRHLLNLRDYFPRLVPWINGWLVLWLLVNGLDGIQAGLPSLETALPVLNAGLAGLAFFFLFVTAILTAWRGDTPAYFLLVAFSIILICSVLTASNIFWGDPLTLDHYLVFLLQAGFFCSIIFLALGAHYNRNVNSGLGKGYPG